MVGCLVGQLRGVGVGGALHILVTEAFSAVSNVRSKKKMCVCGLFLPPLYKPLLRFRRFMSVSCHLCKTSAKMKRPPTSTTDQES